MLAKESGTLKFVRAGVLEIAYAVIRCEAGRISIAEWSAEVNMLAKESGTLKFVRAGVLEIAYIEQGLPDGWPVVLSHGFPYDVHAYDAVAPLLSSRGARVIVPYLRGFGLTRFLSPATVRTGQQAALGSNLIALLDGLGIRSAILTGYDWGGLASCVAACLWPEHVAGLVSLASYDVLEIKGSHLAQSPSMESVL